MAVNVLNHISKDALERMRYEDEMLAEIERLRSRVRHNEASVLHNAKIEGAKIKHERWQGIVADKDAEIAHLRKQLEKRI